MDVANVNDMYYMATYTGSNVLNALNGVFGLDLDRKNFLPKDLKKTPLCCRVECENLEKVFYRLCGRGLREYTR